VNRALLASSARQPGVVRPDIDEQDTVTCVWFDPGGTTGWAVVQVLTEVYFGGGSLSVLPNVTYWATGELRGHEPEQCAGMVTLVDQFHRVAVGTEDFVLRRFSGDRALLAPVRLNAMLELALWQHRPRMRLFMQSPADAKSVCTDARMLRWGYGLGDRSPHERDALRHALLFLRRARERPMLARAAWEDSG
jgi:hypothetical protein